MGRPMVFFEDLEERVTLQQIRKECIASHDWRGSLRSVRPYRELDLGLSRRTHYRCYLQELGQEPPAKAELRLITTCFRVTNLPKKRA